MGPNDLQKAFDDTENQKEAMRMLTNRIEAIMNIYMNTLNNFSSNPAAFDKDFSLVQVSHRSKVEQKLLFKQLSKTLLVFATEAIVAGEEFNREQYVRASQKVKREKRGLKIYGVETPDLSAASGPRMEAKCACGHVFGDHAAGEAGFCMDIDCTCSKFIEHTEITTND